MTAAGTASSQDAGTIRRRHHRPAWLSGPLPLVCAALFSVLWTTGCRKAEELEVTYGQRRGTAASSVNGTSVLATMFEQTGFRAYTWRYLSPRLRDYSTIVWTPDDFGMPGEDTVKFFEQWLANGPGKTLVYIGRDYDAASDYWRTILPQAPPEQRTQVNRRFAQARAAYDSERLEMPADRSNEWFTMRRDEPIRLATQLRGDWGNDIDAGQARIATRGLLEIPAEEELLKVWGNQVPTENRRPRYTGLLKDGERALVTRITRPDWRGGKIIVVVNGSFLLNFPLVNREHRKLAMKLIRECEPAGKVAFLETGPGGPLTLDYETPETSPDATRRRVLLAAHWFVLGLLYCFCVYPIFGRPKPGDDDPAPEFGQHVDALATLLEKTHDEQYARRQLAQYRDGPAINPTAAQSPPLQADERGLQGADPRHIPKERWEPLS